LAHHSKKHISNYQVSPKIEVSVLKYRVPPILPTYLAVKRRTTFAQGNIYLGLKVRCHGEHVGEHIENFGNTLGI
jgi:hypothetical protein